MPSFRGLWSIPGVPHKGWENVEVIDLEEVAGECEMCLTPIRYEHVMSHPDWPSLAGVGCVCAEKMSDGYVGSMAESRLKSAANAWRDRRNRWRQLAGWRLSAKGNYWRLENGVRLLVWKRPDSRWGAAMGRIFIDGSAFDAPGDAAVFLCDMFHQRPRVACRDGNVLPIPGLPSLSSAIS